MELLEFAKDVDRAEEGEMAAERPEKEPQCPAYELSEHPPLSPDDD
jgi:hypothetical protein